VQEQPCVDFKVNKSPVGAALCCEEAIAAKESLLPYRPLRSTGLLLQGDASA